MTPRIPNDESHSIGLQFQFNQFRFDSIACLCSFSRPCVVRYGYIVQAIVIISSSSAKSRIFCCCVMSFVGKGCCDGRFICSLTRQQLANNFDRPGIQHFLLPSTATLLLPLLIAAGLYTISLIIFNDFFYLRFVLLLLCHLLGAAPTREHLHLHHLIPKQYINSIFIVYTEWFFYCSLYSSPLYSFHLVVITQPILLHFHFQYKGTA